MTDQSGIIMYQSLKIMFDSVVFQMMYGAALLSLIVSAWGLFLPLNKSREEKTKSRYPFIVSYGLLMISNVFLMKMNYSWSNQLYEVGLILSISICGVVILIKSLQRLFDKQKTLDGFMK